MEKVELQKGITWFHHASCLLQKDNKAIYIDPWELPATVPPADLILITHEHFDHYAPPDISKLTTPNTELLVPQSMFGQAPAKSHYVKPGDILMLGGVRIEVVPAYNSNKQFHPRSSQWVGYIVEMGGVRYYHAGDTDYLPEMSNIRADVVFLPVGGTYTMNAREAAKAVATIKPGLAVPIHWGKVVGQHKDAVDFIKMVGDKGWLLEPKTASH